MLAIASVVVLSLLSVSSSEGAVLTVTLSGSGSGTITGNQKGTGGNAISCSNLGNPGGPGTGVCSEDFTGGTTLTLTAIDPALFQGWTGGSFAGTCQSGRTNPCQLNVTALVGSVNASFRLPPGATTTGVAPGQASYTSTLQGEVNPEGEAVNACYFEYDTVEYKEGDGPHGVTTFCDQSSTDIGEGNASVPVSAETEPLEPGTKYHFRLVAAGADGDDLIFTGGAPLADECSNKDFRAAQGIDTILLPDCGALEMVSPPRKGGQPAKLPQLSADGERAVFVTSAALADTPSSLSLDGNPFVASRGISGWNTTPTAQPGIFRGWHSYAAALSFTPDLSAWLRIGATHTQYYAGKGQAFRGSLSSTTPLSPVLEPVGGGEPEDIGSSEFRGASADHSHLFFIPGLTGDPSTAYLPGDPHPSGPEADHNTYVAKLDVNGNPSVELMSRDNLGKVWGGACGSRLGGTEEGGLGPHNQGAISADGNRAYFSTRPDQPDSGPCQGGANKLRILERLEGSQGVWIGELFSSECDRAEPEPCSTADGDDFYQGASVEGSKVYFTTVRQLADSDLDTTMDLYLFDASLHAGQRLTQVSAGEVASGHPSPGSGAEVLNGTTAISGDGSRVYFVAKGPLTTDTSPKGLVAVASQPNLYLWDRDSEALAFIGTLVESDGGGTFGLWGGAGTLVNGAYPVPVTGTDEEGREIGGDGHILVFLSKAPLAAGDADGGFRDVFRYDAGADTIELVSKPAPGVSGGGSFDVAQRGGGKPPSRKPPGTDFAEHARWVSEDGKTIVLTTAEKLVAGDVNRALDGYLWQDGTPYRLPGVPYQPIQSSRHVPALSHDGAEVALQTTSQLLPQDGDLSSDIYVVRAGGGFPVPVEPVSCDPLASGSCQGPAATAPAAPSPASGFFSGPGNPHSNPRQKKCPKGKRKVRRGGKVRCVARHKRTQHQRQRPAHADRRAGK